MSSSDRAEIRAYLLRRMTDEERGIFETRLLDEPDLLRAVRDTEEELLRAGVAPRTRLGVCAGCFLAGAMTGAVLVEVVHRILD